MARNLTLSLGLVSLAAVVLVIGYDLTTRQRSLTVYIHQQDHPNYSGGHRLDVCLVNDGFSWISPDEVSQLPHAVFEPEDKLKAHCPDPHSDECLMRIRADASMVYAPRPPTGPYQRMCVSGNGSSSVTRPIILGSFDDNTPLGLRWRPRWMVLFPGAVPIHETLAWLAIPSLLGALALRLRLRHYRAGRSTFVRMERFEAPAAGRGPTAVLRRLDAAASPAALYDYLDTWPDALFSIEKKALVRIADDAHQPGSGWSDALDRLRRVMNHDMELRESQLLLMRALELVASVAAVYLPLRYLLVAWAG